MASFHPVLFLRLKRRIDRQSRRHLRSTVHLVNFHLLRIFVNFRTVLVIFMSTVDFFCLFFITVNFYLRSIQTVLYFSLPFVRCPSPLLSSPLLSSPLLSSPLLSSPLLSSPLLSSPLLSSLNRFPFQKCPTGELEQSPQ